MKVALNASALMTHYAGDTTSVATCWRIEREDGVVMGFTDHDAPLPIDGLTYLASTGLSPAQTETQTRLAVDNTTSAGLIDSSAITAEDLTAGVYDYAAVRIFAVNWASPADGQDVLMEGRLGEVELRENRFSADVRGLSAAYAHEVGALFQPTCRATLGDARCGVNLSDWSDSGTIEAVSADGLVITDSARVEPGPSGGKAITGITRADPAVVTAVAHGFLARQVVYVSNVAGMTELNGLYFVVGAVLTADTFTLDRLDSSDFTAYASGGVATPRGDVGWWDYGLMTMTSGDSAGLSMEVKAYVPGTLTLQMQFPRGVAVNDTYNIVAGCGKRFTEDCVVKFANGLNFRGEPHLPGMDRLVRVGGMD